MQRVVAAQKRDVRRETPMQEDCQNGGQATPSQIVIAKELLSQLLRSANPRDRLVLLMRADGETQAEISAELGMDVRTVRRVIDGLKQKARRDQESKPTTRIDAPQDASPPHRRTAAS